MKPIKLIISGIGPYADTMPEIDFTQFEEKGVFLISGDTGSGKTTIFDAICFALYGKTSGKYRDTKNLRSEYAKDTAESFVDFYFSHQGKDYHVWRKPSYERAKLRGKGTTSSDENAVLYCEGVPVAEGNNPVAAAVKELLHVDSKQFKQIAMIAQGEFWALLNAKTEERTEILRTIFMTESYNAIVYELKDRMNASYQKRVTAENSVLQYFREVEASVSSVNKEELQLLQERAAKSGSTWNIEEFLNIIEALLQEDAESTKELSESINQEQRLLEEYKQVLATATLHNEFLRRFEELQEEKKSLEAQKQEMAFLTQKLERQRSATREVKPVYESWRGKQKDLANTRAVIGETELAQIRAKEQLKQAMEREQNSQLLAPRAEELNLQVHSISEDREKYEQRDFLQAERLRLEGEKEQLEQAEACFEQQERTLADKIQKLEEQVLTLQRKPEELTENRNRREKLQEQKTRIEEILGPKNISYRNKQQELGQKQKLFLREQEAYRMVSEERQKAERVLEGCRAGILAAGLTKGTACPVCGSTEHPHPAVLPKEHMTEEAYTQLQEKEKQALQKKDGALLATETTKASFEAFEEQLLQEIIACLEPASEVDEAYKERDLDKLLCLLQESRTGLLQKLQEKEAQGEQLEKACAELKVAQSGLQLARGRETEELKVARAASTKQMLENKTALAQKQALLGSLSKLAYSNWETAYTVLLVAQQEAKQITDRIEAAKEEKTKAEKYVAQLAAVLDTHKQALEKQQKEEAALEQSFTELLQRKQFADRDEFLGLVATEAELSETEGILNRYLQAVNTNAAQLVRAGADAEGKVWVDTEALQDKVQQQSTKAEELREQSNRIRFRYQTNAERQKHIGDAKEELEKLQKENGIYSRLYKLAAGQTGKGKITLEQYIQAAGFDHILMAANRRLLPMSDGQFELYRQDSGLGKQSNNFLDLEVLNNFTGKKRPVGNLSGGESFKASLSLALGLSDTVSSNLGGIQMDALFVDEGFGTLDRKSIESAMDILIHLSGTNKLVGIISHREELMENIPQQIRVEKKKEGSCITIDMGV